MELLRIVWQVTAWLGRTIGRSVAWSAPRVSRAGVTYGKAVTRRYRERAKVYAEHGRVPVVQDLTTGWWMPADQVRLQAPTGGDPQVREQQRAWLAQQRYRDDAARARLGGGLVPRLTIVERVTMWWRRENPNEWLIWVTRGRITIAARTAARLSRQADRHWPDPPAKVPEQRWYSWDRDPPDRPDRPDKRPEPDPIDLDAAAASGGTPGGTMANDVRSFEDLRDPDVDPFEYPEELPDHLGQAKRVIDEYAEEFETDVIDLARSQASALHDYAEYMTAAEVVPAVVTYLEEAAEAYDAAVEALRRAHEQMEAAANAMELAQRAADAEYGDNEVPRFDKAG